MVSKLETIVSWISLPVYVWQGISIRKNTMRLEPPKGDPFLSRAGKGESVNILILGDSSAAGVGVNTLEESLGGHLLNILSEKTGQPVNITVCGNNSATAGQIRDHVVPHLERADYDFICLNLGTNDAKNFHRGKRFCKEFGALIYALKAKFPKAQIIWGGIIDMSKVPALPSPLNKLMDIRCKIIRNNGEILCRERGALAPKSNWQVIPENFAEDGFHASSLGYQRWAEELADFIVGLEETVYPKV